MGAREEDVEVDLRPEKVGMERVAREVDCWAVVVVEEPWRWTAERERAA